MYARKVLGIRQNKHRWKGNRFILKRQQKKTQNELLHKSFKAKIIGLSILWINVVFLKTLSLKNKLSQICGLLNSCTTCGFICDSLIHSFNDAIWKAFFNSKGLSIRQLIVPNSEQLGRCVFYVKVQYAVNLTSRCIVL